MASMRVNHVLLAVRLFYAIYNPRHFPTSMLRRFDPTLLSHQLNQILSLDGIRDDCCWKRVTAVLEEGLVMLSWYNRYEGYAFL